VIQAISKGMRFGWGHHWPGKEKSNRLDVLDEMRDVVDKWNEFAEREGLPPLDWKDPR